MSNDRSRDRTANARTDKARAADHAAIDRLADELLPALAAKLAATGLGEIEVREEGWKVRIRRPAGEGPSQLRRSTDRPSRSQPGHAGHGHSPAGLEGHRSAREGRGPVAHSTNGSSPPPLAPVGPGGGADADPAPSRQEPRPGRTVATSPAVGVYQPQGRGSARDAGPIRRPARCRRYARRRPGSRRARRWPRRARVSSNPARPSSTARSSS